MIFIISFSLIASLYIYIISVFSINGYSAPDRTAALALAQDYRRPRVFAPPPHYPMMYILLYSHPIVTTCLYTSALLVAELGSCLHP